MTGGFKLTPAQQAAAVDRAGESIALLSGAGCGKTFVLSLRFLQLLQRMSPEEDSLSSLVALTYTRKAALEMSHRVRRMLAAQAREATGAERENLRTWLGQIGEARIGTIHSFCAALLRRHALAAGLDPAFAVADDNFQTNPLRKEASEDVVLSAVEAQEPAALKLLGRRSFQQVAEAVEDLIADRNRVDFEMLCSRQDLLDTWTDQLDRAAREAHQALRVDRKLRDEMSYLSGYPVSDPGDKLSQALMRTVGLAEQILHGPESVQVFDELQTVRTNTGSKKVWGSAEAKEDLITRINFIVERLKIWRDWFGQLGPQDEQDAEALAALGTLAERGRELYDRKKRRLGLLDFDDLLGQTRQLLLARPDVREELSSGIKQLLIDECQDTDAFQVQMLLDLLGSQEQALAQGRLFVVGDAKQSIYRFRGAQVEVFQGLCEAFGRNRSETLDLSFRTHAPGVALVNHVFSELMGEAYQPLESHRPDVPEHPTAELLLACGPDQSEPEDAQHSIQLQAELTAQRITELLAPSARLIREPASQQLRPVRQGDIAILLSRMTHGHVFQRALARQGLEPLVIGGAGFLNQQEVTDLLNALRCVDNPLDDVSFAGLLRSPLVALDDNALLHIAQHCPRPLVPAVNHPGSLDKLSERLSKQALESLREAGSLIHRLAKIKNAAGIDGLLEEILESTGFEATVLTDFQGRQKLGNIRRLIEMGRNAGNEGLSLSGFINQLQDMILFEARQEQALVSDENDDVIRIMTIHKAKGLEFPVVILPDLNTAPGGRTGNLLIRAGWQATIDTTENDEPQGAAWSLSRLQERSEEDRESLRLLYVAMTRHEDYLILVGADWRSKQGRFKSSRSWLDLLDEPLGLARAADAGDDSVRYGGQHEMLLKIATPSPAMPPGGRKTRGQRLLESCRDEHQMAQSMLQTTDTPHPELLGPVPPDIGRIELAVTALSDYLQCPRLYYLRHELRLTPPPLPGRASKGISGAVGSDPLLLGSVLHRCMEWANFDKPQKSEALLQRVRAEMELDTSWQGPEVRELLADALDRLRKSPLGEELRNARILHRELDFLTEAGPALLRGQIDLLYQDASGRWQIVDYKSDRVKGAESQKRAEKYETQMLLYAAAAARHLGSSPPPATLYFLRSGITHRLEWTTTQIEKRLEDMKRVAAAMIRDRRLGSFEPSQGKSCSGCGYRGLCPGESEGFTDSEARCR